MAIVLLQIIICGALCCVHSRLVPRRVLSATAPLLAVLACAPQHHAAVTAATMLADALSGIEGANWLEALGDLLALLQR